MDENAEGGGALLLCGGCVWGGRETIREGMLGGEECGLQCPRPLDNVLRTLLPPDDPPPPPRSIEARPWFHKPETRMPARGFFCKF